MDDTIQQVHTLSTFEDDEVFRPITLQALNDLAREVSGLFRGGMDPILNSQAFREMHFSHGPEQANTMGHYIEMSNPSGVVVDYDVTNPATMTSLTLLL